MFFDHLFNLKMKKLKIEVQSFELRNKVMKVFFEMKDKFQTIVTKQ